MNLDIRAILLAATFLAGSCGIAGAAGRPDEAAPARGRDDAGDTTSVGAGGLTGSGATRDGAQRTDGNAAPTRKQDGATPPAAGTTR